MCGCVSHNGPKDTKLTTNLNPLCGRCNHCELCVKQNYSVYFCIMKSFFIFLFLLINTIHSIGQCSMCTKTATQLGEKAGLGMNSGILYLMLMPFAIILFIGYRWWKNNKESE